LQKEKLILYKPVLLMIFKTYIMRKLLSILVLLFFSSAIFAQVTEKEEDLKKVVIDSIEGWKASAVFNLNFAQTSLTNWAAGGQNSISLNSLVSLSANYTKGNSSWDNTLDMGYGILRQGKDDNVSLQKMDDKIDFSSKYGYRVSKHFHGAALLSYRSQFTDGYNYPDDSTVISGFMAPAYVLGALGMDYKPNKKLSIFAAPFTGKLTFVMNQTLADSGAYGVEPAVIENGTVVTPGENLNSEFGGYIKVAYADDITENINLKTKIDLFSNYLENPEKIDVNWEMLINMKVNKFINVSLSTQLLYDYDVKFEQEDGTETDKVQFKEIFGLGILYKF
jgi:hypothetical protein